MKYCDLTDKGYKTAIMKKFNELLENSEKQFNYLRDKINKEKEYFTGEIKIVKKKTKTKTKNKSHNSGVKNSIYEE